MDAKSYTTRWDTIAGEMPDDIVGADLLRCDDLHLIGQIVRAVAAGAEMVSRLLSCKLQREQNRLSLKTHGIQQELKTKRRLALSASPRQKQQVAGLQL